MPSTATLPTIQDLMKAYRGEIRGAQDDKADVHRGSNYDIWGGVSAILFAREAKRDRDIFHANYFDHANGPDLDEIIQERFHDLRQTDSSGTGQAILVRTSTAAGAGTIWAGTRIEVAIPNGTLRTYLVTTNFLVGATDTTASPAIESVAVGSGTAIDALSGGAAILRLADPLWDNTWTVQSVSCSAGTVAETPDEVRARMRRQQAESRVGYPFRIIQACKDAGASKVVLFASDYVDTPPGGSPVIGTLSGGYGDVGINRIFVGDAGYSTSRDLLIACRKALSGAAVLGTGPGVWAMAPSAFSVNVTAQLWDDPGAFDRDSVVTEIQNAIVDYFNNRANAFYFRYIAMQGAVMRSVRDVQTLSFSGGPAEPVLTSFLNTSPLPRYSAAPGDINVTLTGPS